MLTLILGTNWKQNKDRILQMVARDVAAGYKGRILMVPELVSHQTERELSACAGDTSSRFAEVLTFSRLSRRVAEYTGSAPMECLDNGGRVVAMAAAARQLHSKLKAYAAVESKPEFLTDLLDAVDEFKRCCVTPEDLFYASKKTEGSLAQKLEELSLIYQAYNAICQQGKRDPRDQMTWLLEQLEDCDFAKDHCFYLDSFPDFSRQHMDILCHLIEESPQVVISLTCDCPGSKQMAFEKAGETAKEIINFAKSRQIEYNILPCYEPDSSKKAMTDLLLQGECCELSDLPLALVKASSIHEECNAAADQILHLIHYGARFRDISIVVSEPHKYLSPIRTIMERANIPLYLSGTENLLEKSVIYTLLSVIDAALSGFSQKDILRYIKSCLSPLDMDMADRMENYAILWSVEGSRWAQSWHEHPYGLHKDWTTGAQDHLDKLNQAREKVMTPLLKLRDGFRKAVSVPDQVEVVYQFLKDIRLEARLQSFADDMTQSGDLRNAQIMNQLWEILISALEQLHGVLVNVSWDSETFNRLLKLLLSQYDVGTIPSVLDAVTYGSVSNMRCHRTQHLFVLGASEGVFPSYAMASGVLNDQERSALIKLGISLNPGAIDGLQTQFSEIYDVFCSAEEDTFVSYCQGQPSYIYNRLLKMNCGNEKIADVLGSAAADPLEAAAMLVQHGYQSTDAELPVQPQILSILSKQEHQLGKVDEATIRKLYGDQMTLSATQIDKMANCKMAYFLKYGLSAKERTPVQADPAEFGTYVHDVLENTGKKIVSMGGFKAVSLKDALQIASEFSAEYYEQNFSSISTERMIFHFHKNTRELLLIVAELWNELQESDFQPVDFELHFGEGGKMPAIPINSKKINAVLSGYVDRVDLWQADGTLYLRVVDYKTGEKSFDYCDILNGYGLQMLLYLFALEDGGEDTFGQAPQVAGVQYFPARVPFIKADGSLSEEAAAAKRAPALKRSGLLLNNDLVLYAMENDVSPKRLCVSKKADGTLTGDLASGKQFSMLKKYIFKLLGQMVDDVASGNITANPYTRGDAHNACRYCPYGAICYSFQVQGRRNYKTISAERFWADIEEEV